MVLTAVDAPFSNGLKEGLNQTFVNNDRQILMQKKSKSKEKTLWTTIAQDCVEKYNKTEHTITEINTYWRMKI